MHALSFRNTDVLHAIKSDDNNNSLVAVPERTVSVEEIMLNPRLSTTSNPGFDDSFLFTFDLHNEWDEPFKITFDIYNGF